MNDNPPVFTQKEYTSTVAENAALNPPAKLLQVRADDLDSGVFGEVRYFIIGGNEKELFKLDSHTGIIYPAQSLQGKKGESRLHILIYGQQFTLFNGIGIYNLTVSARDTQGAGTYESTAVVVINVLGVNQHRPLFVIPALSNATIEIPGVSFMIMKPSRYLN